MPTLDQEAAHIYRSAELLHDSTSIAQALDRMASEITAQLARSNPLALVVLTGGMIPASGLLTRLDFPLEIDYLHATRYRGATVGGQLHWKARPTIPLVDRHVLLVDDILDEGHTLQAIVAECRQQGAASVRSAVLVEKQHQRRINITADFVGLVVPDRYVFGYGMDYKGYLRNLPGIYAVAD